MNRSSKPALQTLREQAQTIDQLQDQMLRLQADYENARKRWANSQAELRVQIKAEVLSGLLDILDDFERAIGAAGSADSFDALRKGVELIAGRIQKFIEQQGIIAIQAQGQPFDPVRHEAVAHEERTDHPDATVIEELRKGYQLGEKILRPAVVKISKHKEVSSGKSNRN